jgi:transcriptional regulator with XRE-family HTH domain
LSPAHVQLGPICKHLRENHNLSLEDASNRCHIDRRRISLFEQGGDKLTFGEVERLTIAYKCDLVELLCLDPATGQIRLPSRLREKLLNVLLSELLQNEQLPDAVRAQLPAIFKKLVNKIHGGGSRIELKINASVLRKGIFQTNAGKTCFGAQSDKIYDPGQGRYRNQARTL